MLVLGLLGCNGFAGHIGRHLSSLLQIILSSELFKFTQASLESLWVILPQLFRSDGLPLGINSLRKHRINLLGMRSLRFRRPLCAKDLLAFLQAKTANFLLGKKIGWNCRCSLSLDLSGAIKETRYASRHWCLLWHSNRRCYASKTRLALQTVC